MRRNSQVLTENPEDELIIGHGSGSFGHVPAKKYSTRNGVHTSEQWRGFHEVWQEARALNLLVTESLIKAGIPAIPFAPSSNITTSNGSITTWNLNPLHYSVTHKLVPVVFGDVVFDSVFGGTILSTEEIFFHLAPIFKPTRILLAGIEEGVWEDYPARTDLFREITPTSYPQQKSSILHSGSPDVTGGMLSKVENMLQLVKEVPTLAIQIFSGVQPGSIYQALSGSKSGTHISN